MKKYISNFHFITHDHPTTSHLEQVQMACEAGAKFIQYRCLTKTDEELIAEIHAIAETCDDWGTTLIIANHYHLLAEVDAQGVHIEDIQADFVFIRKEIGEGKTLGASANTLADIIRIAESSVVDYIGCGPFATTQTKPNNFPLLGVEGYRKIAEEMRLANITIPALAVGGVQLQDVAELIKTGIYGVAVSAAVNVADDPRVVIKEFRKMLTY